MGLLARPLTCFLSSPHFSAPTTESMRPTSFRLRFAAFLLAAFVLFAGQAHAQDTEAVARGLQQRYRALDALQADFVQTIGGSALSGTLTVQGDAFRIELPDQVLVSDGVTLWSYSAQDNQVVVQDYRDEDIGFSIGQLFTDYLAVFRPTGVTRATFEGTRHDVLALVPREAGSSVQDATLYVRSADAIPTMVRVHDVNGQTLAFDLRNVRLNPTLADGTFTFRAPTGAEVIDLRS